MTHDRSAVLRNLEQRRMRREGERLRTFLHWPADSPLAPGDLARAGFFYRGPGDGVQCYRCGGVLRCWAPGASPTEDHRRLFPACGLVPGGEGGNGPSDAVDGQLVSQLQRMTVEEQAAGRAVHPEMEAEEARLATFHSWPPGASARPDLLSRAGFFYTGHGDNVKCFFCDGGLRNWEPEDDPWQEHAKWFPRCEFLLQTRGQGYVSGIQDSHFHHSESVGGSQAPVSRDISSANDVEGGGGLGGSSAMLSPVVQTVLRMGFPAGLVESLVQTRYLLGGRHYTSVSDLVSDVLQAEGEERQSREPEVLQGPSTGPLRTPPPIKEKAVSQSPEEQLRRLQEERTCKVCMDQPVSMVFIPCGHLVVCSSCASSLRHCPICRARVRGSVRAFLS